MGRTPETIATVRGLAVDLLREIEVGEPPLPIADCLEARKLKIADQSLDALLAGGGTIASPQRQPDAMLDIQERSIWLREGLHPRQVSFGTLHEVGHDVLPWQRDVLYYCSIFDLPPTVQREWELEANAFVVTCLFLDDRFTDEACDLPFGLASAKRLAERYESSYEAAFRYYVERQSSACCLLVSRVVTTSGSLLLPGQETEYEVRYYVKSPSFPYQPHARQRFTCEATDPLFAPETLDGVVGHEFLVNGPDGPLTFWAQSFSNTYKLFTLLSAAPFPP